MYGLLMKLYSPDNIGESVNLREVANEIIGYDTVLMISTITDTNLLDKIRSIGKVHFIECTQADLENGTITFTAHIPEQLAGNANINDAYSDALEHMVSLFDESTGTITPCDFSFIDGLRLLLGEVRFTLELI